MIDWTNVPISTVVAEIEATPSFIQEVPPFVLEALLNWSRDESGRGFGMLNNLLIANPGKTIEELGGMGNFTGRAESIRRAVEAEQERRNPDPFKVAQREKGTRIAEHFNRLTQTPAYAEKMDKWHLQEMETHLKKLPLPTDPDFVKSHFEHRQQLLAVVRGELEKREPKQEIADGGEVDKKGSPENTTARQVLAMYYLFEYMKAPAVDRAVKARFIHFLTGKNQDSIYKKLSNPFDDSKAQRRRGDMQFVRQLFESLGLSEAAKLVTNDLETKI